MIEEEVSSLIGEQEEDEPAAEEEGDFFKRFPLKLSQVAANPEKAKRNVTQGAEEFDQNPDDDVLNVNKGFSAPVAKLKPSQSSMNIGKALGMALGMIMGKEGGGMPLGGNLGAFISQDNFIMDGHHRWIATTMVDPSKEIGGFQVPLPGTQLIAVLNAMTAGQFGQLKGKDATGGFGQFEEGAIKDQLDKFLKDGIPGKFPKNAEWVANAVKKFSKKAVEEGGAEAAVAKFVENLKSIGGPGSGIASKLPSPAPARPDMPVIDPDISGDDAYQKAIDTLEGGLVDYAPPYHKEPVAEGKNLMSISKNRLKEIIQEELANRKRK